MKKIKFVFLLLIILGILLLIGCAAGPNPSVNTPDDVGKIYGFWYGLWHGIIFPVAFIISLFNKNVHFYEAHNNGLWYNIGYVIGLM